MHFHNGLLPLPSFLFKQIWASWWQIKNKHMYVHQIYKNHKTNITKFKLHSLPFCPLPFDSIGSCMMMITMQVLGKPRDKAFWSTTPWQCNFGLKDETFISSPNRYLRTTIQKMHKIWIKDACQSACSCNCWNASGWAGVDACRWYLRVQT